MKISQLSKSDAIDVIAECVLYITDIAMDKDAAKIFTATPPEDGESMVMYGARLIRAALPPLLRSHKDAVLGIVAAVNRMDVDEYMSKGNAVDLIADIKDMITDEDLRRLFPSAQTGDDAESSESVQENTKAEA